MSPYDAFEVAKSKIMQVQSQKNVISEKSVHQNQKKIAPPKILGFSTQNQKKLHLIWSPDEQVMAVQNRAPKSKLQMKRGLERKIRA